MSHMKELFYDQRERAAERRYPSERFQFERLPKPDKNAKPAPLWIRPEAPAAPTLTPEVQEQALVFARGLFAHGCMDHQAAEEQYGKPLKAFLLANGVQVSSIGGVRRRLYEIVQAERRGK